MSDARAASLDDLCDRAMSLQVAGRLADAEPIYRTVLLEQPRHAAANHCLGMLKVQLKQPAKSPGSPQKTRADRRRDQRL